MPQITLSPLSSRKRRKPVKTRVSAAVCLEETLYQDALKVAELDHDNNFSRYVRTLINADLKSGRLALKSRRLP